MVTPGPAANLELWIEDGESPVDVGDSVTLGVSATDQYGNPVDASGVVITSSVSTDVIDGLTVQFPTASPHVLTATQGDATASWFRFGPCCCLGPGEGVGEIVGLLRRGRRPGHARHKTDGPVSQEELREPYRLGACSHSVRSPRWLA